MSKSSWRVLCIEHRSHIYIISEVSIFIDILSHHYLLIKLINLHIVDYIAKTLYLNSNWDISGYDFIIYLNLILSSYILFNQRILFKLTFFIAVIFELLL